MVATPSKSLVSPEALAGLSPEEVAQRYAKTLKNAARKARRLRKQELDSHKCGVYYDAEISGWRYLKPRYVVANIENKEHMVNGHRIKYLELNEVFNHETSIKNLTQAHILAAHF